MIKIICGFAIIVSLTACLKKHGCTDNDAINYSVDAKENDQSCYYPCNVQFYWVENDYDEFFTDSGSVFISIFLDDEFIGDDSLIHYVTGSFDCGDNGGIKHIDTNYYEPSSSRILKVVDQNQKILVNQLVNIGGECQLDYLF